MAQQRLDRVELAVSEDTTLWSGTIRTREKSNGTEKKETVRTKATSRRQVFIICLPGTFWACQKEDVPMMARGQTVGPWPQLSDNIQANRRWLVMVMNADWNRESPTQNDILNHSLCFDWPRYGGDGGIDRIERIQHVGYTHLSNEEIQDNLVNQHEHWGKDHPLLWNSQYFALTLAAVILHEYSFQQNRAVLRQIYDILLSESMEAAFNYMKHKHIACMGGFAVFGVFTGGVGAFAFWSMAGVSMASHARAEYLVNAQKQSLSDRLERFRILIMSE